MTDTFLNQCIVISNSLVTTGTHLLRLQAPEIAASAVPGQFVMLQTGISPEKGGGPLLKRPFSIHQIGPGEEISIIYRVVGVGTNLLSYCNPGDSLNILGPLGHGFSWDENLEAAYLVGGGIGVAPLLSLSEAMGKTVEKILFYGEKSADFCLPYERLKKISYSVELTTEDGSAGIQGLVTAPLAERLETRPAPIFACGPRPMMAAVAHLAARAGVECTVSMEAHMACGMGACLGCVTEINSNEEPAYARICLEGPVFKAEDIKW